MYLERKDITFFKHVERGEKIPRKKTEYGIINAAQYSVPEGGFR